MRKFAVSCSAVMIALPLLAACGGSSDKPAADSITIPTDVGSKGGSSDFSKLFTDSNKQKFKITFTAGNGNDSVTYAQDGKGNSSFSSSNSPDSQTFTSSDGSVACRNISSTPVCSKVSAGIPVISPLFSYYTAGKTAIDALGNTFGDKTTKTIAGRKSTCISISIKGSASYCVDEATGVLMEISRTDENGTKSTLFEVTKFEEPSAADFKVPATPTTGPAISIPTDISIPKGISIPPGVSIPSIPGQ